MSLAREFEPHAITLDVRLSDMSGWTLLDRLKHDPSTAHIPVHVVSGHEGNRRGYSLGAMSCLQKAVTKESLEQAFGIIQHSMEPRKKRLLVISDNDVRTNDVHGLLGGPDLEILDSPTPANAMDIIDREYLDGIVLDWALPDRMGIDFIETVQSRLSPYVPPIAVLGTRKVSDDQVSEIIGSF